MKAWRPSWHATVTVAFVACAAHAASAAGEDTAGEGAAGQSLEQAASDPTASLMSVSVQDIYSGSYHQLDDASGNTLLLRSSVPFTTGSRVIRPVVAS